MRRVLVLAGLAVFGAVCLESTRSGEAWLEDRLARPLAFQARHALGKDPKLDPRLVLYAFGDTSVSELGAHELGLAEWESFFEAIAKAGARAVYVNDTFDMPPGLEEADSFVKKLASLPLTVVTSAHVAKAAKKGLAPLDPGLPSLQIRGWVDSSRGETDSLKALDWLPVEGGVPYGANEAIRRAFPQIGHFDFASATTVKAFHRLDREHALAAAPFWLARKRELRDGTLRLDERAVPMNGRGEVIVNLAVPAAYYDRMRAIGPALKAIREGQVPELPRDAVVVVLPRMATTNTYYAPTAFGSLPGSLLMVAVANSVLTGEWPRELPGAWLWVLFAGLLGILLGLRLRATAFWVTIGLVALLVGGTGLALFAFRGLVVPWLGAAIGLFAGGLAAFVERTRFDEKQRDELRAALDGAVSPERLRDLLARPGALSLEPTGRVVTIMFIDIVGFSLAAEKQTPREAFTSLRELMGALTECVHERGGVVDKTIGDGMLCFFGYHYDGTEIVRDHADQALRCAVEIQRRALERQLASPQGSPIYPLRIGINTAAVYIGDLGGKRKIDLTIIGHGVNFAKRLESACDTYSIMIGASTRDTIVDLGSIGVRPVKRLLQIKHFNDLVEAYECDPFENEQERRAGAIKAYRLFAGIDRMEQRFPVPDGVAFTVSSKYGAGSLVNFSHSGLGVRMDRYLGRGVTLSLMIDDGSGELSARLREMGLAPLVCEVRWGKPAGQGAEILGLLIKNLGEEQRRVLHEELRRSIARRMPQAA